MRSWYAKRGALTSIVTDDLSIRQTLANAAEQLSAVSDSPRLDAEILLAKALDVPRSYLIAHPDDRLDAAGVARFSQQLMKRLDDVPIAYLVGRREFWSLELMVTPATLVPRPETELLVELALQALPRHEPRRVADLGTGSGAIALAIAHERPLSEVIATDASAAALDVAAENARQHDIDNVQFAQGSWTDPLAGEEAFDLVVSNPPYVATDDPALAALRHEPQDALLAGADGLDAIRIIAEEARTITRRGAALMLEHGADQRNDVRQILSDCGWHDIESHNDLAGKARIAVARQPQRLG